MVGHGELQSVDFGLRSIGKNAKRNRICYVSRRVGRWIALISAFNIDRPGPSTRRHQRIGNLAAEILFPAEAAASGLHHWIFTLDHRLPHIEEIKRAAAIEGERDRSRHVFRNVITDHHRCGRRAADRVQGRTGTTDLRFGIHRRWTTVKVTGKKQAVADSE